MCIYFNSIISNIIEYVNIYVKNIIKILRKILKIKIYLIFNSIDIVILTLIY